MRDIVLGGLTVIIFVISFVGGFFGYHQYQSYTYDDLLKKSDSNWVQAKDNLSQVNITKNSYDTNIKYIKNAINLTDEAINQTQQMVNNAPDNETYAYAQIRLTQYQNARSMEEYLLKLIEDIKTNGIFVAIAFFQDNTEDINNIGLNIAAEQNQLIQVVNSNPSLNQRLVNVLGQDRVNGILKDVPEQGNGTGAIN